jgi:oxygen-dependent protoporphyrinogen oxidase
MSELVDRLVERMPNVRFVTADVDRVEPGRVHAGEWIEADAVVVATPGPVAARLLGGALGESIAAIPHVSTATVSLGWRASDVPRPLDATGFVIPRGEKRKILACTWTSSKFEERAPDGHVLLRAFVVGEPGDAVAIARAELREILGITAEPAITKSFAWRGANPVYEVGHEKRVAAIESRRPSGLWLTGSGYRGVGLPDCIRDGTEVARQVLTALGRSAPV